MDAVLVSLMYLVPTIAIWAIKMLILYFILKKAFYRALVKFHDTHGFSSFCEEPEEAYSPTPEEIAPEELPGQAK